MTKKLSTFLLGALIFGLWACKPPYQNAMLKFEQYEFIEAIPLFEGALSKVGEEHEKGKIYFHIAESYRKSNNPQKAKGILTHIIIHNIAITTSAY